ncbi:acyl-CoA carboxylase subunit epsilon [Lapillicoccus sp.]|uniref:acyl-CoA carboxylase subunit epsilon n=1 Tax=Lapillicoccus sp. TaxID=1909287 RepID=UPI0039835BAF
MSASSPPPLASGTPAASGTPVAPATEVPDAAREVALRVVSGCPTDAELAALVVVLAGLGADGAVEDGVATSSWASPGSRHRTAYGPGVGAWRASGLPR